MAREHRSSLTASGTTTINWQAMYIRWQFCLSTVCDPFHTLQMLVSATVHLGPSLRTGCLEKNGVLYGCARVSVLVILKEIELLDCEVRVWRYSAFCAVAAVFLARPRPLLYDAHFDPC